MQHTPGCRWVGGGDIFSAESLFWHLRLGDDLIWIWTIQLNKLRGQNLIWWQILFSELERALFLSLRASQAASAIPTESTGGVVFATSLSVSWWPLVRVSQAPEASGQRGGRHGWITWDHREGWCEWIATYFEWGLVCGKKQGARVPTLMWMARQAGQSLRQPQWGQQLQQAPWSSPNLLWSPHYSVQHFCIRFSFYPIILCFVACTINYSQTELCYFEWIFHFSWSNNPITHL